MPIKTIYTNKWGDAKNDAVFSIHSLHLDYEAMQLIVEIDVHGDVAEYLDPDVDERHTFNVTIQKTQSTAAMRQAALTLMQEVEKKLLEAHPENTQMPSEIDLRGGTIDDTLDNTQ